ncbi:T9SS type A sorting domain-containing protein [Cytophagaceae bacterium DM2B3-1]|uniref:T9SS type A sorting domain-containing protein n=1 Tax=Xanthocytophaga flava TaxID=3048013 RepID=A0ABT7CGP7_9BACT|nr:T9SS type A sorting domain-containing protein [Xanthocytophaga flavus]MDJ1492863.1 T9SS type A sorting domain-containing protein [Xanthocytophaga flavus]
MKHYFYSFFWVAVAFFFVITCQAQLRVAPLTQTPPNPVTKKAQARTQALKLPFFEDFSTYFGQPDPAKWENHGVVINNTYADDQPSKGMATFDGLQFNGLPYTTPTSANQSLTDTTDILTSQPIDLTGQTASTKVNLSFWWSGQSLGESPDPGDSLVLQFKDNTGAWVTQWADKSATKQGFKDTLLNITNTRFFHSDFQFRFIAYGRPTGMYDVWNLDYIILDANQTYDPLSVKDMAATQQPRSLLKRYSAMPLNQFQISELTSADTTYVFNNQKNAPSQFNIIYTIVNTQNNAQLYSYNSLNDNSWIKLVRPRTRDFASVIIPGNLSINGSAPLVLQSKFEVNSTDNTPVSSIDVFRNDTIGRTTVLSDYYAYDDGTAEYGIGVRQQQGSVAVRYILNKPDTITAIRIHFARVGETDLTGQTFGLSIWKKLDGQTSSILYQKSFAIQYPDTLNKFYTYTLTHPDDDSVLYPVGVSDTIYIGWIQATADLLAVGYDRNTDSHTEQFYNIAGGANWQNNTEPETGSIMLRPVVGKGTVTGTEPNLPPYVRNFKVYPNPSSDKLYWNENGVTQIKVQDMLGRVLKQTTRGLNASNELSITDLPNGMYILTFQLNSYQIQRKIIIAH